MNNLAMRQFLADESPVQFDDNGEMHSAFPFTVLGENCPHCHSSMVLVCGLEQCPACPVVNEWIRKSMQDLAIARVRMNQREGKKITIQIVADSAKQEAI